MALDTQLNGTASLVGVFLFLTTVATACRFLARYRQKGRVWADDYFAVAAWVGFVGMSALFIYGMANRFVGYKEPKSSAVVNAQHPTMELVFLSLDALEIWTFGTIKMSVLFFYRRIFCTRVRRDVFDWTTIVLLTVVGAWIVTFFIMTFRLCGSHDIHWLTVPGNSAKCSLIYPYFEATTISDFALDVMVLFLAFPKIWSFHMTTTQKLGLSFVFLLALGGLGASIARMVVYVHIVNTGRTINDEDGYQTNTQMAYYAILEGGLSIVCVSMPTLWYFVAGVKPEKALKSLRSLISLHSQYSQHSQVSRKNANGFSLNSAHEQEISRSHSHGQTTLTRDGSLDAGTHYSNSYAARLDLESQQHLSSLPEKSILVEHNVDISRD